MGNVVDALVAVFTEIYESEFFNGIMTTITDYIATINLSEILGKIVEIIMGFIPIG